jgi:Holliday junction DNA helicase RuvA
MIGKIKGILSTVEGNKGLIDTASGLSYEVFLTPQCLTTHVGEPIEVITYLQVREDNLTLYGFEDRSKYRFFTMFLSVDGVGPKSAFTIVSHTNPTEIVEAVSHSNVEYFSHVPGIGKKTAQKIVLELSHKMDGEFEFSTLSVSSDDTLVFDALTSLGFMRKEIQEVLTHIDKTLSVEERVKKAIQLLTSKK